MCRVTFVKFSNFRCVFKRWVEARQVFRWGSLVRITLLCAADDETWAAQNIAAIVWIFAKHSCHPTVIFTLTIRERHFRRKCILVLKFSSVEKNLWHFSSLTILRKDPYTIQYNQPDKSALGDMLVWCGCIAIQWKFISWYMYYVLYLTLKL